MADIYDIVQIPLKVKEQTAKYVMLVNPSPNEIDEWSKKLPDDICVQSVWLIPIIMDKEIALSVDYSNIVERYHTTMPLYFPCQDLILSKQHREEFVAQLFNVDQVEEIFFMEC